MLYNRIFRPITPPVLTAVSISSTIGTGFTQYSPSFTYLYLINFTIDVKAPPPVPYTTWRAILQKSTDAISWTNTASQANYTFNPGLYPWAQSFAIPAADTDIGVYYRIAIFLVNPTTLATDEFVTASSVATGTPLTEMNVQTDQIYGSARDLTATASTLTGLAVPTGANRLVVWIMSRGGNGNAGTMFNNGGGGGGGRTVVTSKISILSNYTFDLSCGASTSGVTCVTTGDQLLVNNGQNGSVGAGGLGATTDAAKTGIFNVAYTQVDNGTNGLVYDGGISANQPFVPVNPVYSTGPFGGSGLPIDDAIIAGYSGCGGNGVPSIWFGASPAQGSGAIVRLTFIKV